MEPDRSIMRETTRDFQTYYSPMLHGEVRLDTNTNVLGSNPAAAEYLRTHTWDLNGYPDTYSRDLRAALGELYGVDPDCIIAGNGSDEMIDVIFKTFTNWGDNSVVPIPSYSLYDYFVRMNGGRAIPVDLTEDYQLDVDSMVKQENAKVTIVPSPNNPTGNCFRTKDLEDLISRFDGIVVMDEAYTEYTGTDGFMVANRKLTDMMMSVKIPYSLNAISEGAAVAALKDQDFVRRSVQMVTEQRPKLEAGLRKLGFEPFPSDSNFILARSPIDHTALVEGLKKKGVLIRDFGSKRRTENCVRPTVGTEELNRLLLEKTAEVIDECR